MTENKKSNRIFRQDVLFVVENNQFGVGTRFCDISKEDEAEWANKDPPEIAKTKLKTMGLLDDEEISKIEAKVMKELEEVVEFARNGLDSDPKRH